MVADKQVPVLCLDIDGTVRQGKDDPLGRFVNGPEDVMVFPEAVVMMRRWKEAGGRVIGVSNQGGIGLGIVSAQSVMDAMIETVRQSEFLFDTVLWCGHHPDSSHVQMARCWCRKPSPGLIIQAFTDLNEHFEEVYPLHMALMVGDRPEDEQCARLASIDFEWAHEWRARAGQ